MTNVMTNADFEQRMTTRRDFMKADSAALVGIEALAPRQCGFLPKRGHRHLPAKPTSSSFFTTG